VSVPHGTHTKRTKSWRITEQTVIAKLSLSDQFEMWMRFLFSFFFVYGFFSNGKLILDIADCNRTYYAGTGESYRLLVAWPKLNQMPFLCYLTFTTATPQDPSQLLQVIHLIFWISFFVSEPIHRRHTIEISIHSIPHEMPFPPSFFKRPAIFLFLGSNWRPSWIFFIDQS
jgi:hypothetical protein